MKSMDGKSIFEKNESIALKGLLVVIMFWSHMFNHSNRLWQGITWTSMGTVFGKSIEQWLIPIFHVAVPLFFFIGGYGFYIVSKRTEKGYTSKQLFSQVKKLYVKYWIVFMIFIPLCFALSILKFDLVELILNFIGLSSSYCGEWWFFSTYLLILCAFWLVYKFILNRKKVNGIVIIVCSLAVAVFGYAFKFSLDKLDIDTSNILINEIYYLLIKQPMFVTGYVCARDSVFNTLNSKIDTRGKKTVVGIICTLLVIVIPYITSSIPETFVYSLYTPLFTYWFCIIYRHFANWFKKIWIFIGKNSTYMWLCHSLLLYKLVQNVIYAPSISILCWLVLVVLSLAVSIGLNKIENLLKAVIQKICSKN